MEEGKHRPGRKGAVGNGDVRDVVPVENGNIEASIIHCSGKMIPIIVERVISIGRELGEEDVHHLHEVSRMDELWRSIDFLHEDRSLSCNGRVDDSLLRFHHYGLMAGEAEG